MDLNQQGEIKFQNRKKTPSRAHLQIASWSHSKAIKMFQELFTDICTGNATLHPQ